MADQLHFKLSGTAKFVAQSVDLYRVTGPGKFSAVAFTCGMNRDSDGAPNCYGPASMQPLEFIGNATNETSPVFHPDGNNSFAWVGVLPRTPAEALSIPHAADQKVGDIIDMKLSLKDVNGRFPVKQMKGATAGFYVSTTSAVADAARSAWEQERYWNAAAYPYGALTPALTTFGVQPGDFGIAIRNATGAYSGYFYADWGNAPKVGECSRNLFSVMFPNYPRESNEHGVSYLVFPGSGSGGTDWRTPNNIQATIRRETLKAAEADNADELPLFIAVGMDRARLKSALQGFDEPGGKFPAADFERISRTLALLGFPYDGDFHPSESSPHR